MFSSWSCCIFWSTINYANSDFQHPECIVFADMLKRKQHFKTVWTQYQSSGWLAGVLTDPFSMTLLSIITALEHCSQIISQKWPQVFRRGPCADKEMYLSHLSGFSYETTGSLIQNIITDTLLFFIHTWERMYALSASSTMTKLALM